MNYGYLAEGDTEKAAAPVADSKLDVRLVSGETITVQKEQEARWFADTRDKYLADNKFTEVTDLQDLDRLLILELTVFRWGQHLAAGRDYDDNLVSEDQLRKQIKETSDTINKLKATLSLDRGSRNKAVAAGNFAEWFADMGVRAAEFGIHRQNQLNVALAVMNDLSAQVGAFYRSNEEERHKLGFKDEAALLAWVRDDLIPRYHEVDQYFQKNVQSMWKRDL